MNTSKDFERAAQMIAALKVDEATRGAIAGAFSAFFQTDNPRFDVTRFCLACMPDNMREVCEAIMRDGDTPGELLDHVKQEVARLGS